MADVDLTTAGSTTTIDGAIFQDSANIGSGTGNYETFLALGDNDGNEAAFNSDDTPPLDASNTNLDHAKSETLLLSSIPIIIGTGSIASGGNGGEVGVAYYEFRVDLNEANSNPSGQISLDTFQLYTSSSSTIMTLADLQNTATLRYDMDGNGDTTLLLSEVSTGSGTDDYSVLVPVSKFGAVDPATTYLYLYTEMGFKGGDYVAGSGFEEWNTQKAGSITGVKFEDMDGDGFRDAGEPGVGGVTIFIDNDFDGIAEATDNNGVLDDGERSTVTASDGSYTFYGVPLGTWHVAEVVPLGQTRTTGAFETVTISSVGQMVTVDPIGNFIPRPDFSVVKTAVSITGGAGANGLDGANSDGDTVNYTIAVTNTGNVTLTGYVISDPNATTLVRGADTNGDGDNVLEVGETWNYTATHVVTQAELNGKGTSITGAIDGDSDTDNRVTVTTTEAGSKFSEVHTPVLYDPNFTVVKTAVSITGGAGANGLDGANSDGDTVNYTIAVTNTGNVTLTGYVISDPNATTLVRGADTNGDGDNVFEVGETWNYTATHVVTQAELNGKGTSITGAIDGDSDTDNRVTVTTTEAGSKFSEVHTPVIYSPAVDIIKFVSVDTGAGYIPFDDIVNGVSDANNPTGPLASVASDAIFKVVVTNTGNVDLTGVTLADVWSGHGNVNYTTVGAFIDLNGNTTQEAGEAWSNFDTNGDGKLDAGSVAILSPAETFSIYYHLPFEAGQHTNTVTVTADQPATDTDAANYYGVVSEDCVGVRTPGFWKNWTDFWDGDASVPKQAGQPGFADHDLIYKVDSSGDNFLNTTANDGVNDDKPLDTVAGLLIGDYNKNGVEDAGEDTIFINLTDANKLIDASQKQVNGASGDGLWMLGRDVVATWLNYLANNPDGVTGQCLGTAGDSVSALNYLNDAIDWLQANDGSNDPDIFAFGGAVKTTSNAWKNGGTDLEGAGPADDDPYASGAAIHSALDYYNNTGHTITNGVVSQEYCCSADDPVALAVLAQIV